MEQYQKLAQAIRKLVAQNGETDASALSWELNWTQSEVMRLLKEMEEQNWVSTYEIDMCCGEEYVVDGFTEEGLKQFFHA